MRAIAELPGTDYKKSCFLTRWLDRLNARAESTAEAPRSMMASPDVRVSAHGDGLALLHVPSGRVYLCNSTGCRIWHGVLQGLTPDAVSEQISEEFGVVRELARRDTAAFVSQLEEQGFLVRS